MGEQGNRKKGGDEGEAEIKHFCDAVKMKTTTQPTIDQPIAHHAPTNNLLPPSLTSVHACEYSEEVAVIA